MAGASGTAADTAYARFPTDSAVADAHRQLLTDKSIQFDLPPPPQQAPPPQWLLDLLHTIGSLVKALGPLWTALLVIIALVLLAMLFIALFPPARRYIAGLIYRRSSAAAEPEWRPEADAARSLLEAADALAADGRYDEAVHLILFRSIEDIGRWRGELLRPSLTSRDIAALSALPAQAGAIFGRIAAAVERSLFARRPLARADWEAARRDYAEFALKPV